MPFDLRDAVFAVGLGLMGFGLWQVYEPAAFVVPGAVLAAVGVFGARG